jgi:hypothetical protein
MGVLETRLTADQIYAAKTDASRWHAAPSAKPSVAQPAQPAPVPAPVVATALPQQATPGPQPQSPSKITVYPSPQPASPQPASPQPAKKSDADNLLDQIPQGLRKKFGF